MLCTADLIQSWWFSEVRIVYKYYSLFMLISSLLLRRSSGVLTGLTPSTQYTVTVSACSPAGCTESPVFDSGDDDVKSSFQTPEEGKKKHANANFSLHL